MNRRESKKKEKLEKAHRKARVGAAQFEPLSMLSAAASQHCSLFNEGRIAESGIHIAATNLLLRLWPQAARPRSATASEYLRFCNRVFALRPPATLDPPGERLLRYLYPLTNGQLSLQLSAELEAGRTLAILAGDHPDLPSPDDWHQALGLPLEDMMAAGVLLERFALHQRGWIDPEAVARLVASTSSARRPELITQAVLRHFTGDLARIEQIVRTSEPDDVLTMPWARSPLLECPVIVTSSGRALCPIPRFANSRGWLTSLYFDGRAHFGGDMFSTALGTAFEDYVERVLAHLVGESGQIIREITYDKGQKKSVDFFVVWPDLVLMVEAKAARPIEALRLGDPQGLTDLRSKLDYALTQIDRSAALVADRHPAFRHVPADRPVAGLALTLEPFWMSQPDDSLFAGLTPTKTPARVAHVSELEELASRWHGEAAVGAAIRASIATRGSILRQVCADREVIAAIPSIDAVWDQLERRFGMPTETSAPDSH